MNTISYIFVFVVVCIIGFVIRMLWMGLIDSIVSLFKKLFARNSNKNEPKWHSMEEIKERNKEL